MNALKIRKNTPKKKNQKAKGKKPDDL